jgi:hypothetical protein
VQKIGQNPKINLETNFFLISEMGFLGTFKVKKKIQVKLLSSHGTIWNKKLTFWWSETKKLYFSLSKLDFDHPLSLISPTKD